MVPAGEIGFPEPSVSDDTSLGVSNATLTPVAESAFETGNDWEECIFVMTMKTKGINEKTKRTFSLYKVRRTNVYSTMKKSGRLILVDHPSVFNFKEEHMLSIWDCDDNEFSGDIKEDSLSILDLFLSSIVPLPVAANTAVVVRECDYNAFRAIPPGSFHITTDSPSASLGGSTLKGSEDRLAQVHCYNNNINISPVYPLFYPEDASDKMYKVPEDGPGFQLPIQLRYNVHISTRPGRRRMDTQDFGDTWSDPVSEWRFRWRGEAYNKLGMNQTPVRSYTVVMMQEKQDY